MSSKQKKYLLIIFCLTILIICSISLVNVKKNLEDNYQEKAEEQTNQEKTDELTLQERKSFEEDIN